MSDFAEDFAASIAERGGTVRTEGQTEQVTQPVETTTPIEAVTPVETPTELKPSETTVTATTQIEEPTFKISSITDTPAEPTSVGANPEPFDESRYFSEKFNGKIKSPDEIQALLEIKEKYESRDPLIKAIEEYKERGGTVEDFARTQLIDHTKTSDFEEVIAKAKRDSPYLSIEEIEFELKQKYAIGEEDEFDERTANLGKIKLKREAALARQEAISIQQQTAVPSSEIRRKEEERQHREIAEKWAADVEKHLGSFKGISIELGKDKKFDFTADDKVKAELFELANDPFSVLKKFPTAAAISEFFFKGLTYDKMAQVLSNQERSAGTLETLNTIENPATTTANQTITPNPAAQQREAVARGLGWEV